MLWGVGVPDNRAELIKRQSQCNATAFDECRAIHEVPASNVRTLILVRHCQAVNRFSRWVPIGALTD